MNMNMQLFGHFRLIGLSTLNPSPAKIGSASSDSGRAGPGLIPSLATNSLNVVYMRRPGENCY